MVNRASRIEIRAAQLFLVRESGVNRIEKSELFLVRLKRFAFGEEYQLRGARGVRCRGTGDWKTGRRQRLRDPKDDRGLGGGPSCSRRNERIGALG